MPAFAWNARVIALLIGAVVLIVGLVGFTGTIPGLSVAACGNPAVCPSGVTGISPQFTIAGNGTVVGTSVVLTDHSVLGSGVAPVGIVAVSWGDSRASSGFIGGAFPHAYSVAGTYSVTDTVTAYVCLTSAKCTNAGPSLTGSLTRTVTVLANGTSTCGGFGSCGKSPKPAVAAAFSWTINGLALSVTDHSVVTGATETSITWKFGDGSSGSGTSMTHAFAIPGSYNVTEVVVGQVNTSNPLSVTVQGTVSNLIPVSVGNSTGGGSTPSSALIAPPSTFANPIAAALVAFGVIELAIVLLWKNDLGIAIGIVVGLVGAGAAYGLLVW